MTGRAKICWSHPQGEPQEAVARVWQPSEDQPLETGDQQPVKTCKPAMTSPAGVEGVLSTTGVNHKWIHFEDGQIPPMAPGAKMMFQRLSSLF